MKPKSLSVIIWLVLAASIIFLSFGIIPVSRDVKKDKKLLFERLELANNLRTEGLKEAAIEEYNFVLESRFLKDSEKARISTLLGNIYYEDLKNMEKALEYYTRAKFYARGELDKDTTINQRLVECLERLNRKVDAQNQLDQSTHLEGTEKQKYQGAVVAKVGEKEITMGELDAMINKLPKFRKDMIKTPKDKLDYLREYTGRYIMSKAAKRQGIDKKPEVLSQLAEIEEQLLASALYQKEVVDKISITDIERKYYYQNNKDKFNDPLKMEIAHIQCDNEEKAKKIYEEVKDGDFAAVAKEKSADEKTKDNGGVLGEIIKGSDNIPSIGKEKEAVDSLLNLKEGAVSKPIKTADGWHVFKVLKISPEKDRAYEEVQDVVDNKIKMEKENSVRETFINDLMKTEQVYLFEGEFGITAENSGDSNAAMPPAGAGPAKSVSPKENKSEQGK